MIGNKDIPGLDKLRSYGHAVAGHAGVLQDEDGHLFVKPCTQTEVNFYESANRDFPEFADLMPLFMGTLQLTDPAEAAAGQVDSATAQVISEQVASVAAGAASAPAPDASAKPSSWVPNKSKKIKTDQAVVLDNASAGFKHPNILDAKMGVRLWADDAPIEKKERFDKITASTTHKNLGFRIAGMRVYRGSENSEELDDHEYKVYNKDYGRYNVNEDNVVQEFRKFVFNKSAGIDEELGKAVCEAIVHDLKKIKDILERHESRMYSASVLFVMEGHGETLREAIEENNEAAFRVRDKESKRIDSGIAMEEDEDIDDDSDAPSGPQMYAVKLIDFAHAEWTPGQGPDENVLIGVRSLIRIFEEMAK
ncbi:inositol polyphosphate kinase-domain-containing protein [Stachybotrys elegans]|uniref:Kinase n=1 Tax=Stachybotrys elegans TaxID=80388 RepID=A0A8K0WUG1_9HYPO|nr:inositol polyphosphate kinase-domain-containing protein [Stachybotrys elegans]